MIWRNKYFSFLSEYLTNCYISEIIQILGCWLLGLVLGIKLRILSTRILSHFCRVQSPHATVS